MSDQPEIKVRRFSRDKRVEAVAEETPAPSPSPPPPSEQEEQEEEPLLDIDDDEIADDSFLDELKGEFEEPVEEKKPREKAEPPRPSRENMINDLLHTPPPAAIKKRGGGGAKKKVDEFGDLFGKDSTPILGKERRELLTKIQEYKALFPEELKGFKIKPNATVEQLQASLNECEVIVSCSSGMNKMLDEAILSFISVFESISARTENWDVSGTAAALRENPEFRSLAKRLYLKHRLFSDIPVEGQLALLVCGTMMTMRQVNIKRKHVSSLLSQEL
jgi:hypothetical protein